MQPDVDRWTAALAYERYMGRWSRLLARDFVLWLNPPSSLHWLEAGCGTGALTSAICAHARPASVTACDPAAPFIEYARQQLTDNGPPGEDSCKDIVVQSGQNLFKAFTRALFRGIAWQFPQR